MLVAGLAPQLFRASLHGCRARAVGPRDYRPDRCRGARWPCDTACATMPVRCASCRAPRRASARSRLRRRSTLPPLSSSSAPVRGERMSRDAGLHRRRRLARGALPRRPRHHRARDRAEVARARIGRATRRAGSASSTTPSASTSRTGSARSRSASTRLASWADVVLPEDITRLAARAHRRASRHRKHGLRAVGLRRKMTTVARHHRAVLRAARAPARRWSPA